VIPLAVLAGYLAGLVVAVLAIAAEHSQIAFGSYALSGNGALIVPSILAPFALYPGWTWLLGQHGDRRLEAALYALGLHLGVGMISVLDAVLFPQSAGVTILDALPGFLLNGSLFVIPAALVTAATLWLIRSGRVDVTPLTTAFAIVISALTALLFGAGLGILTGGAISLALERAGGRATIGIALFVLLVIVGNAPYLPALFAPLPIY
jgi:hypothetical protein